MLRKPILFNIMWNKNNIKISRLDDTPMSAQSNMLRDQQHSEEAELTLDKVILRYYDWIEPSITLGRNQSLQIATDYIHQNNLPNQTPVSHRPTGGGLVYHLPGMLTFSLVIPLKFLTQTSLLSIYTDLSKIMAKCFTNQGYAVELMKIPVEAYKVRRIDPLCKEYPSRYELEYKGQKAAGSAQLKLKHNILQQTQVFIEGLDQRRFKDEFAEHLQI